jgi:hypothetical protein
MIRPRTTHLLRWSLLLPTGFVGVWLSEIYLQRELSKQMPGWKYIDASTPWYFDCCGYIFFLGCFLALLAFISLLWDCFSKVREAE